MPRGKHPNSLANLKPINQRSKKEQRKIQTAGGIASGKARATYKTFRGNLAEQLTPEKVTEVNAALIGQAISGSTRAYELIAASLEAEHGAEEEATLAAFILAAYIKRTHSNNKPSEGIQ